VKPGNVQLTSSGQVRVADLGTAVLLGENNIAKNWPEALDLVTRLIDQNPNTETRLSMNDVLEHALFSEVYPHVDALGDPIELEQEVPVAQAQDSGQGQQQQADPARGAEQEVKIADFEKIMIKEYAKRLETTIQRAPMPSTTIPRQRSSTDAPPIETPAGIRPEAIPSVELGPSSAADQEEGQSGPHVEQGKGQGSSFFENSTPIPESPPAIQWPSPPRPVYIPESESSSSAARRAFVQASSSQSPTTPWRFAASLRQETLEPHPPFEAREGHVEPMDARKEIRVFERINPGHPDEHPDEQGHPTSCSIVGHYAVVEELCDQKPKDIRQEIANVVNSQHNTNWTELQVKSKIGYVKTKYHEAAKMNSTGQGAQVTSKQLEVCPEFTRLHEITDDESSDLEPHEDTSDIDFNAGSQAEPFNVVPPNKRRRGNGVAGIMSPAVLATSVEEFKQMSDQHRLAYDETKIELSQREQAVEIRERELTEKLLRLAEDSNRLAEEARVRLRQELAAERAEFRKEMAQERAELKRERAEFSMERDQLKMGNAALRKELEVRTVRSPQHH
ncbi:hypothetical protein BGX29_010532, partial [Mortierella sp. GBA35]